MKSFEFRLDRLLDVRRLREEIARRDLAAAQTAAEAQRTRLGALREEEDVACERVRALQRATLDVARLRIEDEARAALGRQIRAEEARLDDLERDVEAGRRALTEARKAVRVLDRFRERQLRAWRYESARREQKFLDEVAQNGAAHEIA